MKETATKHEAHDLFGKSPKRLPNHTSEQRKKFARFESLPCSDDNSPEYIGEKATPKISNQEALCP